MLRLYDKLVIWAGSALPESLTLLFVRVAFAGIFWRSGQTKTVEGHWFQISDATFELFRTEYSGVPLPPHLAAVMAASAEHVFPILLVLGLLTRLSALALLGMALVIQIFVYPDAWWPVHSLWTALALVLIVRGSGRFAIDPLLTRTRRA